VRRAVLLLYGVCAIFAALSLGMVVGNRWVGRWLLAAAAGFGLLVAYSLGYLRGGPQGLVAALRQRRRTQALLGLLDEASVELQAAGGRTAVQAVVARFATALGRPLQLRWPDAAPSPTEPLTRYPVGTREALLGYLELPVAEADLGPDERTLVQLLCDLLAPTLVRLR
jgi:hypothetical protein